MRRSTVGLMGMAALLGSLFFAPAFGAPTSQSLGLRAAEDAQSPIQDVQFFWDGLQYCWFDFGWRGPGWYVCDHGGRWWGGPSGFRGWAAAVWPVATRAQQGDRMRRLGVLMGPDENDPEGVGRAHRPREEALRACAIRKARS